MTGFLRGFSIGVLSLLLTTGAAWAQLSTAQLSGRVTDESGAVLPGATVTVTQTDTGFTRTDVTDGNGSYVLSNLPPGPYRLEVSLQGFRTYVQTGIVLQVAASPVINAALAVGARRGVGHRGRRRAAGGRAELRHQRGRPERGNPRAAAQRPQRGRARDDGGRGRAGHERADAGGARRHGHFGRRRTVVRRGVPARRRHAQQPAGQPEPAVSLPGRAAGVQRGDERPERPAWDALRAPRSTR